MIQFFFQSGEFISTANNFWFDIFKAVIGPILGGIISFLIAYYIFYRTTKTRKQEEEDLKIEKRKENVKYFQTLLNKCYRGSQFMIDSFKKCSEENSKNFYKFIENDKISLNDFDRLINKLDQQLHYNSYIEIIKTSDSNVQFMKLYGYMDFFLLNINTIEKIIADRVSACFDEQLEYRDIIDDAIRSLLQFTVEPSYLSSHAALIKEMGEIFTLANSVEDGNIEEYERVFSRPMASAIMKDSKRIPILQSSYFTLIKARKICSTLVFNNKGAVEKVNKKIEGFEVPYKKFNDETIAFREMDLNNLSKKNS